MIDLWSGLGGTLVGAGGGTYLAYWLSLKHERASDERQKRHVSEALAYQIMYQVQVDIACTEAIRKIAKDVGIPPHMPETRNVFYPMWQHSRKMSTLPYREFLRQALELDWNETLTTALSDSIFVIQELTYAIENLSLTWEDAVHLPNPQAVREELWNLIGASLRGETNTNLSFAKSTLKDLLKDVQKEYRHIAQKVRLYTMS